MTDVQIKDELRTVPIIKMKEKACRAISVSIEQVKAFLPEEIQQSHDLTFQAEKEFAKMIVKEVRTAYKF